MLEGNIRVVRSEIRRLLCDRDLPLETKDLQMHNGPESGFRCEARDKDLAKINCRLGLGPLSGQELGETAFCHCLPKMHTMETLLVKLSNGVQYQFVFQKFKS